MSASKRFVTHMSVDVAEWILDDFAKKQIVKNRIFASLLFVEMFQLYMLHCLLAATQIIALRSSQFPKVDLNSRTPSCRTGVDCLDFGFLNRNRKAKHRQREQKRATYSAWL